MWPLTRSRCRRFCRLGDQGRCPALGEENRVVAGDIRHVHAVSGADPMKFDDVQPTREAGRGPERRTQFGAELRGHPDRLLAGVLVMSVMIRFFARASIERLTGHAQGLTPCRRGTSRPPGKQGSTSINPRGRAIDGKARVKRNCYIQRASKKNGRRLEAKTSVIVFTNFVQIQCEHAQWGSIRPLGSQDLTRSIPMGRA
jgi:hypothetical protein